MKRVGGRRIMAVAVAAAAMVLGLGVAPAYGVVTVSPNSNLPDPANVLVSGTGFTANQPGTLMECKFDLTLMVDRCKDIGMFNTTSSGNFGPVAVTVTRTYVSSDLTNEDCNAPALACRVVASLNAIAQTQETTITFAASPPPPASPRQSLPGVVTGGTSWSLRNILPGTGAATTGPFAFGIPPVVPLMGDWNGDGTKTASAFEAGTFRMQNSVNGAGAVTSLTFGDPRGFPVAGDFNGDTFDDLAVYRDSLWQVHITGGSVPDYTFNFGSGRWPLTVPVAGDWDGDGVDGVGFYNLTNGSWTLRQTATATPGDFSFTFWAGAGSYPVVGDWDADGDDSVGVKKGTLWSLNNTNDSSPADVFATFGTGASNELPVVWSQPVVTPTNGT